MSHQKGFAVWLAIVAVLVIGVAIAMATRRRQAPTDPNAVRSQDKVYLSSNSQRLTCDSSGQLSLTPAGTAMVVSTTSGSSGPIARGTRDLTLQFEGTNWYLGLKPTDAGCTAIAQRIAAGSVAPTWSLDNLGPSSNAYITNGDLLKVVSSVPSPDGACSCPLAYTMELDCTTDLNAWKIAKA